MNTALIIPTYNYSPEIVETTIKCIESVGPEIDEIILQEDEVGEGYTKTVNKALAGCMADIIFIGNNDMIFPKGWVTELMSVMGRGYDIATCWTSDQKDIVIEDKIEPNALFGSIFGMTRKTFRDIGFFDEMFPGYFTDNDYRERALALKKRIGKTHNLVIGHKAAATYSKTDPREDEFYRSARIFEAKWGYLP